MALIGTHAPFRGLIMELQSSLAEEVSPSTKKHAKPQTAELKNGSQVPMALAKNVMIKLLALMRETGDDSALFLSELVLIAREGRQLLTFESVQIRMSTLGFLDENGEIYEDVRNIILSSASGKDQDLSFVSPFKD